jgi:hypothetical protein
MRNYTSLLKRFNPAVSKYWLLALAGLMWAAVGVMLCTLAYGWLTHPLTQLTVGCAGIGLVIALVANRFGFAHLAQKNIDRILRLPDRPGIFAFQAPKSYFLIIGMILLGVTLRHSPLPKPYLAVIYVAIGGALLQASLNYFGRLYLVIAEGEFAGRRRG